ncbi:EscF/YscF/HrpA family type III secretion system needle major subunit [Halodesulfovibrio marinisediminis]|uniref:Type III secretion system major needle protein, YscF/MxiH/PrgI family n=1 Tax=Halodesulfovibrio marinisediminis DSM 17456 TaxID=1121457 RepID=A0A1N6I987_9BACT|nr:EscF/YscF/HrpA family type III secretion system needle major subunit [Halodesulfovibrio marinisediminis]SIO28525.1 type III secretion system major needle protein, YscF/MxiH/PrgI family [Halodesulfovibrio marinisediminis DSM 17456]
MSLDLNAMFAQNLDKIEGAGEALQNKMQETLSKKEVSPQKMLSLQFELGQYNALLQATSTVAKSIMDTTKSVIQRAG